MKKLMILTAVAAALISCSTAEVKTINVVPYPNEVAVKAGSFDICGAEFHYDANFDEAAQNVIKSFAEQLSLVTGQQSNATAGLSGKGVKFVYGQGGLQLEHWQEFRESQGFNLERSKLCDSDTQADASCRGIRKAGGSGC